MEDLLKNILEEQSIIQMKTVCFDPDIEMNHKRADNILCNVLLVLGYTDLVKLYNEIEKWYG